MITAQNEQNFTKINEYPASVPVSNYLTIGVKGFLFV